MIKAIWKYFVLVKTTFKTTVTKKKLLASLKGSFIWMILGVLNNINHACNKTIYLDGILFELPQVDHTKKI